MVDFEQQHDVHFLNATGGRDVDVAGLVIVVLGIPFGFGLYLVFQQDGILHFAQHAFLGGIHVRDFATGTAIAVGLHPAQAKNLAGRVDNF